jgi:hypothetical protein
MKAVVASALLVAALTPSLARAQSRVSVEVGGMISAYDVNSGAGSSQSGLSTVPTVASSSSGSSSRGEPTQAIAAAEVRPTVTLENGFLMGVGFRAGQAGLGDNGASLVGGDVSIGYQRRFGRFLPFIKGMFGFNSYDLVNMQNGHQTDLRIDAVLGSRLYISQKLFVSASAFAGWGDRYGATVAVGGDVVQYFRRGVMP